MGLGAVITTASQSVASADPVANTIYDTDYSGSSSTWPDNWTVQLNDYRGSPEYERDNLQVEWDYTDGRYYPFVSYDDQWSGSSSWARSSK
jgi:hypothetical protein